jgi:hypothetical protein
MYDQTATTHPIDTTDQSGELDVEMLATANDSDQIMDDLRQVEKSVKDKAPRDPRSSLVDFESEEHQWRLKILQVEYSTALKKRELVQEQLNHAKAENKLKLSILSSDSHGKKISAVPESD